MKKIPRAEMSGSKEREPKPSKAGRVTEDSLTGPSREVDAETRESKGSKIEQKRADGVFEER